jgi:hypothetical protein
MTLENQKFCRTSVMWYGGLALCAFGIQGVSFVSGLALGLAIHGLLLAKREGAW